MKQKHILNAEKQETIRIYSKKDNLDIMIDKNYRQFFIDGTFRCVPKGSINF